MPNPLNNFFKNVLSKGDDSVLGIDIGSASIKVVQLRRKKGKAILETYGELSLGPYAGMEIGRATKLPVDKLVEALNDVMKEANATTKSCAISIPMRSSMVTVFNMPELERKQLAQMVPIEARKYIPVPLNEVTLDWFQIPKIESEEDDASQPHEQQKANQTEVLAVAIHNDVLNNFNSIVAQSKLEASFFEIEMFSTIRSVLEYGDNRPVMIFDMGAGATKVYIVERGVVRDSHIINKGSQDITLNIATAMNVSVDFAERLKRNYGRNDQTQDESITKISELVLDPLFSEVNSVLLNYQRKFNKDISKVVLVGGGSLLNGLTEKANKLLSIEAVPGDPFAKVQSPAFLQNVLSTNGHAFSTAIGLALRKLQELG